MGVSVHETLGMGRVQLTAGSAPPLGTGRGPTVPGDPGTERPSDSCTAHSMQVGNEGRSNMCRQRMPTGLGPAELLLCVD